MMERGSQLDGLSDWRACRIGQFFCGHGLRSFKSKYGGLQNQGVSIPSGFVQYDPRGDRLLPLGCGVRIYDSRNPKLSIQC